METIKHISGRDKEFSFEISDVNSICRFTCLECERLLFHIHGKHYCKTCKEHKDCPPLCKRK